MSTPFTYVRRTLRFAVLGLQLSRPIDSLDQGKYAILKNVRSYTQLTIQPRPGIVALTNATIGATAIHTVKRINDDLPSAPRTFSRFVGSAAALYVDDITHTLLNLVTSGFSGNPLTFIPFRPSESPDTWTYVADSNKNIKVNIDGSLNYRQGILPPNVPPKGIGGDNKPTVNPLAFDVIEDGNNFGSYSSDGVIWNFVGQGGFADTINNILYDTGSAPGWASIVPGIGGHIQPNALIQMTNEEVAVDSVYLPVKNTTVAAITYDSGATGLCTIQPTAHKAKAWVPNALFQLDAELVRVLDVSFGKDNIPSIRASTVSPHTVGSTITGLASWRAFFLNTHIVGEGVNSLTIQPNHIGGIVTGTQGVGTILRAVNLDLSNVNGRPIQDSDKITVAVNFRAGALIWTELQIILILDSSPSTTPTDYYQITARPSDFTAIQQATSSTLVTKQKKIQRQQIDTTTTASDQTKANLRARLQRRLQKVQQAASVSDPGSKLHKKQEQRIADIQARIAALDASGSGGAGGSDGGGVTGGPTSTTTVPGIGIAAPITLNVGDVARFGSDLTKNWANVTGILIRGLVNNQTGSTVAGSIEVGGFWIGGTFGPTSDNPTTGVLGVPYLWRYKYRSSTTGARSGHGPATRSGTTVTNSRVQLTATPSTDPQVDKIDWERFGGSITSWKYIGTGPNTSATFNDDFPDDVIFSNPDGIEDFYAPFVIQDIPRTGLCNVSGTMVTLVSGTISPNLAIGSLVIVNNVPQNVYRVLNSTQFEIVDNGGNLAGVTYFIPAGTVQGVPMPIQWGPFGPVNVMFACGDVNNPGRVYYTNPNDPDSTATTNWFEPASPSEAAVSGFLLDERSFVWTSERLFAIYANVTVDVAGVQSYTYIPQKTPITIGLYAKWFQCTGNGRQYFGSKDGIYWTDGSSLTKITNDISLLFPHDTQVGINVNTHIAPDYTQPQFLRLTYGSSMVRFEYKGIDGNFHTLIYDEQVEGWISEDTYTPQVQTSYIEEAKGVQPITILGGADGKIYQLSGVGDNSGASFIAGHYRTWSDDKGDPRTKKRVGDVMLDIDTGGLGITVNVGFDNFATTQGPVVITGAAGRQVPQPLIDINSGATTYAKNVGLDVSWNGIGTPISYLWDWSALDRIEDIQLRCSEWDNGGTEQAKFYQGFRLRANTFSILKTIKVQSDSGVNDVALDQQSYTLTSNGDSVIPFSFDTPFIAHLTRIIGIDVAPVPWEPLSLEWIFELEPELVTVYETQFTSHGLRDWWHLRDGLIAVASNTTWILITTMDDGTVTQYPLEGGTFPASPTMSKTYIRFVPHLQKLVKWRIQGVLPDVQGSGVRVYKNACEIRAKAYADQGPYQTLLPFGDVHNTVGARI